MSKTDKQAVLIVGGGFGGIKTALLLAKDKRFNVTLLSDRPNFRYYPSLFHTATGGRSAESSIPLTTIFTHTNVTITIATATLLNRDEHLIQTSDGQRLHFDVLILGLGVITNFFGIKGLDTYAYGIKSLEDSQRLKSHLHQQLTDHHLPDAQYVVVGGGPTGVELAGQLTQYLRHIMHNHGVKHRAIHIDLVEAAPRLLPRLPKDTSRVVARRLKKLGVKLYLGQTVNAETADALLVNNKPLTSHTVIWTAGVTNHPFFKENKFTLNDKGKVIVDKYLQTEPDIYVLGDNADTPYSGMAQTALHDATTITKNLIRLASNTKPIEYQPKQPITVLPVGHHWSVVCWGQLRFYGWIGWVLRELANLVAFHDLEPWWKAGEQWLTEFGEEESCPVCALAEQT